MTRAMAERYGKHPALALWHVSNEYGDHVSRCWCPESSAHFRRWLRARYGDLDGLNEAWGVNVLGPALHRLGRTSRRRAAPTGPVNPTQLLDFERFSSDALLELFQARGRRPARGHARHRRDHELHEHAPRPRLLGLRRRRRPGHRRRLPRPGRPAAHVPRRAQLRPHALAQGRSAVAAARAGAERGQLARRQRAQGSRAGCASTACRRSPTAPMGRCSSSGARRRPVRRSSTPRWSATGARPRARFQETRAFGAELKLPRAGPRHAGCARASRSSSTGTRGGARRRRSRCRRNASEWLAQARAWHAALLRTRPARRRGAAPAGRSTATTSSSCRTSTSRMPSQAAALGAFVAARRRAGGRAVLGRRRCDRAGAPRRRARPAAGPARHRGRRALARCRRRPRHGRRAPRRGALRLRMWSEWLEVDGRHRGASRRYAGGELDGRAAVTRRAHGAGRPGTSAPSSMPRAPIAVIRSVLGSARPADARDGEHRARSRSPAPTTSTDYTFVLNHGRAELTVDVPEGATDLLTGNGTTASRLTLAPLRRRGARGTRAPSIRRSSPRPTPSDLKAQHDRPIRPPVHPEHGARDQGGDARRGRRRIHRGVLRRRAGRAPPPAAARPARSRSSPSRIWSGTSRASSRKNISTRQRLSFLGAGTYNHFVPAVVDEVISRSEFLTAYAGRTLRGPRPLPGALPVPVADGRAARDGCRQRADLRRLPGDGDRAVDGRPPDRPPPDPRGERRAARPSSRRCSDFVRGHQRPRVRPDRPTAPANVPQRDVPARRGRRRHLDRDAELHRRGRGEAADHRRYGARRRRGARGRHRPDRLRRARPRPPSTAPTSSAATSSRSVCTSGTAERTADSSPCTTTRRSSWRCPRACSASRPRTCPASTDSATSPMSAPRSPAAKRARSGSALPQPCGASPAGVYLALMGPQGMAELGEVLLARTRYAQQLLAGIPGVALGDGALHLREFTIDVSAAGLTAPGVVERCGAQGIEPGVASRRAPRCWSASPR